MFRRLLSGLAVVMVTVALGAVVMPGISGAANTITHWPRAQTIPAPVCTYVPQWQGHGQAGVCVQAQTHRFRVEWFNDYVAPLPGQRPSSEILNLTGLSPTGRFLPGYDNTPTGCTIKNQPVTICYFDVTSPAEYIGWATVSAVKGGMDVHDNFTLVVGPQTYYFINFALPAARVGAHYHALLRVAGGTKPYTLVAVPKLGDGFTVNSKTGVISGVPERSGSIPVRIMAIYKYGTRAWFTATVPVLR